MKWMWTGIWPWWGVFPFGVMLVGLSVWVYRQQRVARPWGGLLASLRALALGLLVLALLQPVLARFYNEVRRAEVLVVVDDSGSMSVNDRYQPARGVAVAWGLDLFPRRLRYMGFEDVDRAGEWASLSAPFAEDPVTAKALKARADALKKWLQKVADETGDYKYLNSDTMDAWEIWRKDAAALEIELRSLAQQMEESKGDQDRSVPEVIPVARWQALGERFAGLQAFADQALAEAEIPEVDRALTQVKEMSRMDLLRRAWDGDGGGLLARLQEKGEVKVYGLHSGEQALPEPELSSLEPVHTASRLGVALRDAVKGHGDAPLAGVVLISDGNQNAGMSLDQFGEWVGGRDVPLVALGVGEEVPSDDLAVERVIAPDTVFTKDRLSLRVRVARHGFTDVPLQLRVMHGDEAVHTQTIPPGETDNLWVDVGFMETEKGERDYRVELEPMEGEWIERNNQRNFQVNVLDDPIRVLLVDAWPRWETRYLDMMLQRDPRVACHTLFYGSGETGRLRTGEGMYPETREDLFGYEVVVLGDVDPDQFSRGQLENLHAFVAERGGTLIWIAGSRYMPEAYQRTPLWDLAPFRMEPGAETKADGVEPEVYQVALTETGKHDPMALISNSDEVSRRLWAELPALPWVRRGVIALPLADRTVETQNGDVPVLIKSYRGLGKLVYLGSDSFWRWRDRARWTYHQRLWGQVILWSALGRTSGSDRFVKLMTDRLRYATGEEVLLRAQLLDERGRPITGADAFVEIFDERGELLRKVTLRELSGGGAAYEASLSGLPEGAYTAKPVVFELRDKAVQAEIGFRIGELATSEYVQLTYDEGALRGATPHVGRVWDPASALAALKPRTLETTRREDLEIWNHPLFLLLAVSLLSAEWWIRRRRRMP